MEIQPEVSLVRSELGNLPAEWALTTIGTEFDIQQGKSLSPAARTGLSPRPFLRTSNVFWGRIDLTSVDRMDFSEDEARKLDLRRGDLLVCEGGDIGRTAVWQEAEVRFSFQNHLHRLRRKTNDILPEFAMYWLQAGFTLLGLYGGVGNKTTIPNLSRSRLQALPIPKPNPDEQRQIVSVLDELQQFVLAQETMIEKLAELKKATMAQIFSEGLRHERLRTSEIGDIPETWNLERLRSRCRLKSGGTPSRSIPEYWNGSIPWVKTAEINYKRIHATEERITEKAVAESSARVFPSGTLLMAMYGQGVTRGRVALLDISAATNQACAAFFTDETLLSEYLYAYFTHAYERTRQQGHGANQQNLSLELIEQMLVPIPNTKEEQRKISDIVLALQESISLAEEKLDLARELFRCCLQSLMTGSIRVTEYGIPEAANA